MIANSLKLTWKLKRKGKHCFKHPTKMPKLQRKAAKNTPKTTKNCNEMGQNTIWNTNIIHHWSPWSKLNLKSRMYTDMLTRMPYNSKKNSKTMLDVTPKITIICHRPNIKYNMTPKRTPFWIKILISFDRPDHCNDPFNWNKRSGGET